MNAKYNHFSKLESDVQRGVLLWPRTKAAFDMCKKFKISLRTAYRYVKAGKAPRLNRRVGKDGKAYAVKRK